MKLIKALVPAWAMLAALAAFCLWARSHVPDAPMPVHFDARFQPDRFLPRDKALAQPVLITAGVLLALTAAPWLLPPKGALERSARAYGTACVAIVGFLAVVQGGVVARALGWPVDLARVLPVALGVLLMLIGNFLSKVRYNWVLGIRTPWTLANETVWDRTHRLAAPLFVIGGLFVALCGALAPVLTSAITAFGVIFPAAVSILYSFVLWARLPASEKGRIRAGA